MRFKDKASGSDGLSWKTLIEGAEALALHSILLIFNRYICSIEEQLSERDRREVIWNQSPSIVALQSTNRLILICNVCFVLYSINTTIFISLSKCHAAVWKGKFSSIKTHSQYKKAPCFFLSSSFERFCHHDLPINTIKIISLSRSITSLWCGCFTGTKIVSV